MASIFTRIIEGEIPGRIVWRDDRSVAMVDIRPLSEGHTLVIPIAEVDHWVDLDAELATHLMGVAREVGRAQVEVFAPARVGLMIAGFEVPHTHLHVVPMSSMRNLDFSTADTDPDPGSLDSVADRLRSALRSLGHHAPVDAA